jgi:hypothetical protein
MCFSFNSDFKHNFLHSEFTVLSMFLMCNTWTGVSVVGASCEEQSHFAYQKIIRRGDSRKISLTPCSSWSSHATRSEEITEDLILNGWLAMMYNTRDRWVLGFVHRPVFERREILRTWICVRLQAEGWETCILFQLVFETPLAHYDVVLYKI